MDASALSPFLRLPLELRLQIYCYALPKTIHEPSKQEDDGLVWQRSDIGLLSANRQISEECLDCLYGDNTFVIECGYSKIEFRFRTILPGNHNLAPSRTYSFLDHFSQRNIQRIRHFVVYVERVDSYTGMIKYNCSGRGLTDRTREQVRRLVECLRYGTLQKVDVRFVNLERSWQMQEVLRPLVLLRGVRQAIVSGGLKPEFAKYLQDKMMETGDRIGGERSPAHRPRGSYMGEQPRDPVPPLLEKILLAS
ncbi:hypothetical protein IWZ00DRAFT_14057 [Phyllosticta capitalensis]